MARPTVMTKEVLQKLEDAYMSDATHLEAATYAGIAEHTLHAYRKAHPKFSQHIDTLRDMTGLQAKVNVRKAIAEEEGADKSVNNSKWYLERRDPDFKPKQEVKNDIHINAADALILALADRRRKREEGCKCE